MAENVTQWPAGAALLALLQARGLAKEDVQTALGLVAEIIEQSMWSIDMRRGCPGALYSAHNATTASCASCSAPLHQTSSALLLIQVDRHQRRRIL